MLDIQALEKALAPIKEVGMEELVFEVEDQSLTLRPLLPHEEVAMQRYAQEALAGHEDEDGADRYAVMEFMNRFRIETIAYSLVQIDDTDLRDVEYIATGEETSAGKPVRVPKNVALRSIIEKQWSRPMVQATFAKYGELLIKIEMKASSLVEFDPTDIEAEVDRLRGRLTELEDEKKRRAEGDPNVMLEQVKSINEMGEFMAEQNKAAAAGPPYAEAPILKPDEVAEAPLESTTASREEEWATFDQMPSQKDLDSDAPPPVVEPSEEGPEKAAAMPETPREPVRPPQSAPPAREPAGTAFDQMVDSFADVDDEEAIAAEEARILAAKRRMAQEQAAHSAGRTPPHMRGASRDDIPDGLSGGDFRAATPEELAAKGIPPHLMNGTEPSQAVVQPTETLSNRGRGNTSKQEAPAINQTSNGNTSRNMNFKPPRR